MTDGPTTLDAFHRGAFHLLQPREGAFRSGHDALLVAGAVPEGFAGAAADLGSGSGALGFAAVSRVPRLTLTMAERNPAITALAERSRLLPENAHLAERVQVTRLDILAPRDVREAGGLHDGAFDLVLTNPPFHPPAGRRSPHALRDEARAPAGPDALFRWIRVASALLRSGGRLVLIARPENLSQILPAAENRLGALACLPVHPAAGAPASRILVSAVRGSRAPFRILPGAVLDEALRRRVSSGEHVFGELLSDA